MAKNTSFDTSPQQKNIYTSDSVKESFPLRVAYIVGGLPFGGIEKWLMDLCVHYNKTSSVQPRVFNLSGTGSLLPDYYKHGIDLQCTASKIRAIASHRIDTALTLRKQLREFAPDIIHTSHFSANHLGRIASLKLGIPVIMHLHSVRHEKRRERRLSDKALSFFTTRYLAVSKAVAQVVHTDHNIANRPVDVLYNTIAPAALDVPAHNCETLFGIKSPTIIAVGRYVKLKNYDLLIKAVRLLHDEGIPVSLLLVGEGPERPYLEALRAELGLEDFVVLTGFRDDVGAFYKASDIFAMTSDIEGFPLAHIESMICGLPGVISHNIPTLEIAEKACLVCEIDPKDIAIKIRKILHDTKLRQNLSTAARDIAATFTMDNYAEALRKYYLSILGKSSFSSIDSPLWVENISQNSICNNE